MNFISALSELDKLYETEDCRESLKEAAKKAKSCTEKACLTEADEEILIDDEPIIEDEEVIEEPTDDTETVDVNDYVLECSKCGALVIKAIKEVTEDEESGLANVGEECAYCEASDGFKVLGTFAPYEAAIEEEAPEETAEAEVIEAIADEEELEEGIFDKKPNVKIQNGLMDFEREVSKISKGEDLYKIATNMTNLLQKSVSEYRAAAFTEYKDTRNRTDIFIHKSEEIINTYKDVIKRLSKPANWYVAYNAISQAIEKNLEGFAKVGTADEKIDKYGDILNQISSIEADKKVKAAAFKQFYGDLILAVKDQLSIFEDGDKTKLFKEELEELFDANVSLDARGFGGSGNDVSVLSTGLGESLDEEDEELEELFNANLDIDARGFGGTGNTVGVL